jgi:ribosomal protein L12E/L44/L45/RPP1/RPP2
MKRTREQYEGGDRLVVNQAALCSLMQFYDSDPTVQACQSNVDANVFDGRYSYFIGKGSGTASERPSLFNTSHFLHADRLVQVRARANIRAIGGCAFWTLANIAHWLQLYVNASSDRARHDLGLPFGVLEPWEYTLELEQQPVGRHHAFHVLPHDVRARGECQYFFYNHDMILLPLDESKLDSYERRAAPLLHAAQQLGSGAAVAQRSYSNSQQRVPQSPFYHLADARDELEQVKLNLLDADWLVAHPKAILRASVSSSEPGMNIPDGDLYPGISLIEASDKVRRRRATMSLQQMANLINSVRHAEGVHGKQDAPRQQQRRHYRYSDMLDDAELWDESAELVHWAEPTVVNDFTRRYEEYKLGVLTAMGLSETSRFAQALLGKVAAREATGLGGRSHIAMLVDRDERNAHSESEQRIHSRVFEVIYDMCGFSQHDVLAVSELVEQLDSLITEEEIRRAAIKNLARLRKTFPMAPAAAAKQMLRVEDPEKEKKKKKKKEDEKEDDAILTRLRVKVADLRAWLSQTARQSEKVSLVFESKDSDMIKLQFYQEMRAAGIVSVKELERQARKVYDDDLHLQEPPPPDAPGI